MSDEDEIGYGKPPKSGQFKKGQSGNPKGRPKAMKSLSETVQKAAMKKVPVNTPHGIKKVSKMDALVDKSLNDALKGDARARNEAFKLLRDIDLDAELRAKAAAHVEVLDEADRTILANLQNEAKSK